MPAGRHREGQSDQGGDFEKKRANSEWVGLSPESSNLCKNSVVHRNSTKLGECYLKRCRIIKGRGLTAIYSSTIALMLFFGNLILN